MNRIAMTAIAAAVVVTTTYVKAMVPEQVKIDSGTVAGTISGQPTVRAFKGIPFAAPPLGENRWKAPQPVAKWDGVRKADAFGAPCAAGAPLPVVVVAAVAEPQHPAQHRRHLRAAARARSSRGLPVPQRLDQRDQSKRQAARDGVDLRWRFHRRLRWSCLV